MKSDATSDRRFAESLHAGGLNGRLVVAFFSLLVFILAHHEALTNPYVINDDVRQQIYWMQQWRDPDIFRGDWLSNYARHYVPWGVQGLYWAASHVMSPVVFSKFLPGFLFVLLSCSIYSIGLAMGGRALAWAAVTASWLMPFFLDNLSGGLARSFALPLLALFWLCWLKRRPMGVAAVLILLALFIPYAFALALGACLLAWSMARLRGHSPPPFPSRPWHAVVLAAGASLVALWNVQFDRSGFGPLVSAADMDGRPEFTDLGRYPILPVPLPLWEILVSPVEQLTATSHTGSVWVTVVSCALLAGLAALGARRADWRGLRPHLRPALYLAIASLALHLLAWLVLLRLFVPSRYVMYTANLFLCLGLAVCLKGAFYGRVRKRGAVILVLLAVTLGGLRLHGMGLFDYSEHRAMCEALARTPKDALIAGHPNLMDNVPVFAQRRAFATFELAHPWSKGLWLGLRPRLEELFLAYYAEDPKTVAAFAEKYGVHFLVVDDRHFKKEFLEGRPFFAPFDDLIRGITKGRDRFAVLSEEIFPGRRIDEHVRILDLRATGRPDPTSCPSGIGADPHG